MTAIDDAVARSARRKLHSILLVEDDLAHAEITRRNLEEFSRNVSELVHVSDGQAALDYLRDAGRSPPHALPNLILLDLRLPLVDGLEVLERVKHDARWKRIPVVVLTTSDAEPDVRGAYERGANGYLVKPLVYADFLAVTRGLGVFWLQANRYGDA
jgi:two-component system, response regulator